MEPSWSCLWSPSCAVCGVRSCWGPLRAPTTSASPLPPPWTLGSTGQHWAALGSRTRGPGGHGAASMAHCRGFFLLLLFFPSLVPLSPGSSSRFNVRFVEAELSEPFKREMSSGRRNAESSFHQPGPRRRLRGMSGQL